MEQTPATPENNKSQANLPKKLEEFSTSQIVLLILVWGLILFLIYRCFLPFRAEYAYREAFNADAQGNKELAIAKYLKAVRLAPWETHYNVQLGKIYEDMARATPKEKREEKLAWIKKAEADYNYCLKISPTNPWYQNRLGEVYGLYAEMAETPAERDSWLKKREDKILLAGNLDKNNALFQMTVAYLYHQKNQLDKALELYKHVLEIDDTFGEAYFNMADIYRLRGNEAKRLEMYQTLIKKKPDFPNAHLQLGRIYESQNSINAAIREYIEEVRLNMNNEGAFQVLGAALFKVQDWANVAKVYNRLSVINPKNTRYYLLHAQAAAKIGNLQEALDALEAAQLVEPNNGLINQNVANLRNFISGRANPVPVQHNSNASGTATPVSGNH